MRNIQKGVRKTTLKLFIFAIAMFGFGYALVPLYDVFCDITGINGKTGRIVENKNQAQEVADRWVKVQFDANINGNLPWRLKPNVKKMRGTAW